MDIGAVSARTYPLGVGAVAIGTCGYVMSGLLPAVTVELGTSPALTGQLGTVFALACGLTAVPAAVVTSRWERRRLLVGALLLAGLGNALAALAPNFGLLLAARIVTALGAAVFTPGAIMVAAMLNRADHRARAVAVVFVGLTLALLLGVPAANTLGASWGYRAVFWLVAALCVLGAAGIGVIVPVVAAPPQVRMRERLSAAQDRRALAVIAMTLLASASTGVVYTYLAPLLAATTGPHSATISLLLAGYGIGAVLGTALGGRAGDRFGAHRALLFSTGSCTVLLAVLPVLPALTGSIAATALAVTAWGAAYWSINPSLASWLVELAPAQPGLLLPLGGSAIYLGVGLGGVVGGLLIAGLGLGALAPVAAVLAAAALAVVAAARTSRTVPLPEFDELEPTDLDTHH